MRYRSKMTRAFRQFAGADAVLISAAEFEGRQLKAACGKAVADARFTDAVLPQSRLAPRIESGPY